MEFWLEEELSVERTIGEQHRDARSWCPSKDVGPAICIDHVQRANSDERPEHMRQGKHSRLSISLRRCPVLYYHWPRSILCSTFFVCRQPHAAAGFRLGRLMRDQGDL